MVHGQKRQRLKVANESASFSQFRVAVLEASSRIME